MTDMQLFDVPTAGWSGLNIDVLYDKSGINPDLFRCSYICPTVRALFKFFVSILAKDSKFYDRYRLVEFDAEGWKWYLGYTDNKLFLLVDNLREASYEATPYISFSLKDNLSIADLAEAWLNSYKNNTDAWLGWDYAYSKASSIFKDEFYTEDEIKEYSKEIELTKSYARKLEELIKEYRGEKK